jgi:antitoxin VapB
MGLNIKNEEAHRLAQQLAVLTGESLTAAVTEAIRERLERLRRERERDKLVKDILEISEGAAALWKEPYKSTDHGDLLYDERGLPK